MPLKNTWANGQKLTAVDQNEVATQVNANTTAIAGKQAADADLTAIAALAPANNDVIQRKSGSWVSRTLAQLKTDLAIAVADIPGLSGLFDGKQDATAKNQPNGYAGLDGTGKVAAAQLPSYVDDVLEFANLAAFPTTGESGKIFIALDSGKTYRWSGSAYAVISETLALGTTSSTAKAGDYQPSWSDVGSKPAVIAAGADQAAARTAIGAASSADSRLTDARTPTDASVTVAKIAGATLVTAAESIASNNNDTTIPTSAAVKAYADSVGGGGGGGGAVDAVVAGDNIDVDNSDPTHPVISVEPLTKADVGLGNVDNTSDATKPVSTAQAAALALKANDSAVVHKTGDESISGNKSFAGPVGVSNLTVRNVSGDTARMSFSSSDAAQDFEVGLGTDGNLGFYNPQGSRTPVSIGKAAPAGALGVWGDANYMSQILDMQGNAVANAIVPNISPESRFFSYIANAHNDLMFNYAQGGSVTMTRNGVLDAGFNNSTAQGCFQPNATYALATVNATSDVFQIEVTGWRSFQYSGKMGIVMGDYWRAVNVKMEVYYSGGWHDVATMTTATGIVMAQWSSGAPVVTKARWTLSNFTVDVGDAIRIQSLFLLSYDSLLLDQAYVSKGGSEVFGQITQALPPSNNGHLANKLYVDTAVSGLPTASSVTTLTNKRIAPRIGTTASSATPTVDADSHDQFNVTALAANAVFAAPTGTPLDGQKLMIRVKDNGTARTLGFNAIFRAVGVTLPTTTVISKMLYVGCVYNAADTKWDVVAVGKEA